MNNRKITDLPEHTRRKILWLSVTALSIIIIAGWLWWLPRTLARIEPATDQQKADTMNDLRLQLQNSIEQTNKQFEQITADDAQVEQDDVIQAMKEKLDKQQTTATSTPTN